MGCTLQHAIVQCFCFYLGSVIIPQEVIFPREGRYFSPEHFFVQWASHDKNIYIYIHNTYIYIHSLVSRACFFVHWASWHLMISYVHIYIYMYIYTSLVARVFCSLSMQGSSCQSWHFIQCQVTQIPKLPAQPLWCLCCGSHSGSTSQTAGSSEKGSSLDATAMISKAKNQRKHTLSPPVHFVEKKRFHMSSSVTLLMDHPYHLWSPPTFASSPFVVEHQGWKQWKTKSPNMPNK